MSPAPDPARRSSRATRAILDATLASCRDQGYRRCTIEGIAAAAGVGKQTIYRWWPSKGALVFAAVLDSFVRLLPEPELLEWTPELRADLRLRLTNTVKILSDERYGPAWAGVIMASQGDEELSSDCAEHFVRPARAAHRARIEQGTTDGELRPDVDPDTLADMLWGPIWFRHLVTGGRLTTAFVDKLLDATFSGLHQDRRGRRSHRAILDAARRCCAEYGYADCTIERIAAAAGVTKQTIYRWWPSKGALLLDAVQAGFGSAVMRPDWTDDVVGDLRRWLLGTVEVLNDPELGPATAGVIADAQGDADLAKACHDRFVAPDRAAYRERIAFAQIDGQLRGDVPAEVVADLLCGPLWFRYLMSHAPITPAYVDAVLTTALNGAAPSRQRLAG